MSTVEVRTHVAHPPQRAFEFFRRPREVVAISDPAIGATLVEAPDVLDTGSRMRIELMAFGTVQKVVYEATVDADRMTVIEALVEGPLKAWVHEHRFEAFDGGCEVIDTVTFEKPGGLAGLLMTDAKIADQLEDGLAYRNARLPDALAAFAAGR